MSTAESALVMQIRRIVRGSMARCSSILLAYASGLSGTKAPETLATE